MKCMKSLRRIISEVFQTKLTGVPQRYNTATWLGIKIFIEEVGTKVAGLLGSLSGLFGLSDELLAIYLFNH